MSTGLLVSVLLVSPAFVQKVSEENVRALNTARMQAESINSGLNNYRASKCINATGKEVATACRIQAMSSCYLFDGGSPGWQEAGGQANVKVEILEYRDGGSVVDVLYNGSPR